MKKKARRRAPSHLCGPLGCEFNVYIVAKDPARNMVLIGGLGALGVGEMWFRESPQDMQSPSYAQAPIRSAPITRAGAV